MSEKTNPFVFVDSVSSTKERALSAANEREYVPWLTNRALSLHADAVLYVNEINVYHGLDHLMQYDYLLHSLRKRGRRGSWPKRDAQEAERVAALCWRWGMSPREARGALVALDRDVVETTLRMYEEKKKND